MNSKFAYISRGTSVRYVEPLVTFDADELDAFLDQHHCSHVMINQVNGRGQADFDEALKSRKMKSLSLVLNTASFSRLANNSQLQRLHFSGTLNGAFEFSEAHNLTSLSIEWQKGIVGLDRMPRLTNLNLRSFKGAENFLEELGFLQELILIEPNVTSIEFLVAYSKLRKLEISYARKLISVAGLRFLKETLIELELTNLPKIEKYAEILSNLKKLRELRLTTCPPLANLEFVRVLKDLEVFTFVGTEILNGDLSPCVGLRYVGFLNKRNYNFIWNSIASRLEEK